MKALVVVAHPDDETIFLGGYILKNPEWDWTVVAVTHSLESPRGAEFQRACERLNAKPKMLGMIDIYESVLDLDLISKALKEIARDSFDMVFTHNNVGEYGHPHHIAVHKAVKQVFKKPYLFGYNSFSDMDVKLNAWELEKKKKILRECYPSQSGKFFMNLFEISVERIISPHYVEASIEASFFGRNDIWSYDSSSYEAARCGRIAEEVGRLGIASILEVGAHEGFLTERLLEVSEVVAFERSEVALARGKVRAPSASWILGDFESESSEVLNLKPDVVIFSEVIYYFNDYKKVLESLRDGPRFIVIQNVSKLHKQIELFMNEQGWHVRLSATSNPFGLGIYEAARILKDKP